MLDSLTVIQASPEMIHNWGWLLAFGIVLAVLGVAAVIRSFAATVASMMFFGWMLLFAGVVEFINAFMVGHWAGFFLHLLASILFIVTGFLLVIRPVISAEVATFVMSMFFLIGGLYQFIASAWTHHVRLGLASLRRIHLVADGRSITGSMAPLRALGDRPVHRNRSDLRWMGVDRAGAWPSQDVSQNAQRNALRGAARERLKRFCLTLGPPAALVARLRRLTLNGQTA